MRIFSTFAVALLASVAMAMEAAKAVTLKDIHIAVTNSQGSTLKDVDVAYPKEASEALSVGKSDALEISFGVSEPTAEQVFVRLQHQDKPIVKTFPTSGPSSGVFVYKLELGAKNSPKLARGKYSLDILVAGNSVKPLQWMAAKVDISSSFDYKPPSDVELVEELEYMFPDPPTKPNAFLATVFSVGVLAPALFLFTAWVAIGVNIKGFQPSLAALIFHGSVALMFGLFMWFWFEITMFEVLYWGLPLGVVMFLSGNQALKTLHYEL